MSRYAEDGTEWVARINADDDESGAIINIGIIPVNDPEHGRGYRVVADNGDDIGYYKPKSMAACMDDIGAMWGNWDTLGWTD